MQQQSTALLWAIEMLSYIGTVTTPPTSTTKLAVEKIHSLSGHPGHINLCFHVALNYLLSSLVEMIPPHQ